MPEHLVGGSNIACLQGLADGGAAGAFARNQNAGRALGFKIALRGKQAEIAAAPFAKAKIVANQQIARVQLLAQNGLDKLLGGLRGKLWVKTLHPHAVYAARLLQKLDFVAQRRDALRQRAVGLAAEKFVGLGLKNHGDAVQPARLGFAGKALQNVAMPCVHAVKIANGYRAGQQRRGELLSKPDVHS